MTTRNRIKSIVILGPTASGKSSVAIKLAQKFNGEIISADSRQIYKRMEIGSGRITPEEEKIVPHHLLGMLSPETEFSVVKFKEEAEKKIQEISERNRLPIICGGTGFWIKALIDDVIYPEVKPDWQLRKKLEKESLENLLDKLKKFDPQRARTVDTKNKIRLIRALEICQRLGKVPDNKNLKKNTKYSFLQIGIAREKEELHQRIKLNVKNRLENGMIAEVEKLKESGLSWKKIESFGLSFGLIPQFIRKEIKNEEELAEKIYLAEKNYAKRQMTWFKK
ncbi:MAG: tRNA (adenosine(37)-N6)-dimethylallyltransferase MiaA, partial [Sphingobacteriia bacterium]|nr:tRNA (adenosine(37)-N6)-dimethylallyltransferase MiaA [Sphingobacteriia bacterium]